MATDSCSISGAAQQTKEIAFECIVGREPQSIAAFFIGVFVVALIYWWLRVTWGAVSARNKGKYDWSDVGEVFFKPLVALTFLIAFFIFIY